MITAGPNDLDLLTFGDWTALVQYANTTAVPPATLVALTVDPSTVRLEDVADELDHLWDTSPPREIQRILADTLHTLQRAGVTLAARDPDASD